MPKLELSPEAIETVYLPFDEIKVNVAMGEAPTVKVLHHGTVKATFTFPEAILRRSGGADGISLSLTNIKGDLHPLKPLA